MVANRKVTGRASSIPAGLGIGTAVALGITILGSIITAMLVNNQTIGEESIGYCAMGISLLSSGVGAYTAQAAVKRQRLIMCAAAAGCYYISLLGMTALFFGGQYQGMGVTALVILCGAALVVLLGAKGGGAHNKKLKKYRYG